MDGGDFYNPLKAVLEDLRFKDYDHNLVFLLHRKLTTALILVMMACFHLYYLLLKDHSLIDCISPSPNTVSHKAFAIYCWSHGSYIILEKLNGKIGTHVPHPGIAQMLSVTETPVYQLTYAVIYPYFIVVYLLFKLPWWLWKANLEKGLLSSLKSEIRLGILKEEKSPKIKRRISNYLMNNLHSHNCYAFKYIVCELLNLFHVFFEMWFADFVLQGEFTTYGLEVLNVMQQDPYSRIDPMEKTFPKVTTCVMNIGGPGGNVQPMDGLCVMPLNSILEHMFVALWFWYIFLAASSCLGIVYRAMTIWIVPMRYWLLRLSCHANPDKLMLVCKHCRYGDWYLIFSLKNMLRGWFLDAIVEDLADKLSVLEERNLRPAIVLD